MFLLCSDLIFFNIRTNLDLQTSSSETSNFCKLFIRFAGLTYSKWAGLELKLGNFQFQVQCCTHCTNKVIVNVTCHQSAQC